MIDSCTYLNVFNLNKCHNIYAISLILVLVKLNVNSFIVNPVSMTDVNSFML